MRGLKMGRSGFLPVSALLVTALLVQGCEVPAPEASDAPGQEAMDLELGAVDFPTSCAAEVQPRLEQGLALLHHMMYAQAEESFREAARAEEECAMAHWGVAMTFFQPLWPGQPGPDLLAEGLALAERAVELAPTEREAAYARSLMAFYEGDASYQERLRRWEAALEDLHLDFPQDQEAATLHALAHLSLDPADQARQDRTAEILTAVHEAEPRHPGAVHYAIHVHDVEGGAEEGEPFARAYDAIAPTVPHALHMPSHIFVRLGSWDEVIEWNRRSADAALEHPAGEYTSHHYPHALDYLMYGYLQQGDEAGARAVLDELHSVEDYQPTLISAYALAAIPARWHVERRDWAGAMELEPPVADAFAWETFPAAEAMIWFARGLGAARTGELGPARDAMERLEALEAEARAQEDDYWARQIQVQHRSVQAWVELAEGRTEDALHTMRTAADLAAEMEKHPITPGDLQPPHELLGDLLVEAGRLAEAMEAYEASLETWPRRYNSLQGAVEAAEMLGDEDALQEYRSELAALTGTDGS